MPSPSTVGVLCALLFHLCPAAGQNADPCAVVAAAQARTTSTINKPGDIAANALFDAETAYNCTLSVPINTNHSLQMIDIALEYFTFQTTLAYLKDPPQSYLQPGIDVYGRFSEVRDKVEREEYPDQYSLDVDILSIVRDTHEGHFQFYAGVLGLFEWILPDTLVSFSSDGKEMPQVYSYRDVLQNVSDPSPVVELGGQPVFAYLQGYVANRTVRTTLDPHADWNVLMQNSAFQFGSYGASNTKSYEPGGFERTTVYNGPSITGSFANGTTFEWKYMAGATVPMAEKELLSGKQVYDNFVMNPDFGSSSSSSSSRRKKRGVSVRRREPNWIPHATMVARADTPTIETAVPFPNYPQDPVVVQKNFSSGGAVSGYLLKEDSVGVLSLPSFLAQDGLADPQSFHDAVADFIDQAKGMKKVVIDLTGNGGGNVYLGYDTYKQFFPSGEPGSAVRARVNPQVNTYGSIVTGVSRDNGTLFDVSVKRLFAPVSTVGSGQVNADFTLNQNRSAWKSWGSFCTPQPIHGDNFTKLATYNLSDPRVTRELGFQMAGTAGAQGPAEAPWAPDDIVLLVDGFCGSTCHIFADLMKNDAGVRSVAVGGIPLNSPMQGVAGTRGTSFVPWDAYADLTTRIDALVAGAPSDSEAAFAAFGLGEADLAGLPTLLDNAPWNVRQAGVNALDMVRFGSPQEPRQFVYEAANCRLFYTRAMVEDVSQVWRAAARVSGGDTSLCVPGSVDAPGSGINETVTGSVGFTAETIWSSANSTQGATGGNGGGSDGGGSDSPASRSRVGLGWAGLVVLVSLPLHFF